MSIDVNVERVESSKLKIASSSNTCSSYTAFVTRHQYSK